MPQYIKGIPLNFLGSFETGALPASASDGDLAFNSTTDKLMFWNGSAWEATGAIGTGTIVNTNVSASAAIDATKIAVASVTSDEFSFAGGTLQQFCQAIGDAIPE